jgi:integrase
MAEYLRTRSGNFYFRLRVPADLRSTFPDDTEILKSLRTKDPKTARLSASCLRPHFLEVFTLTRCGFITDEQARKRIAEMLDRQPKSPVANTVEPQPAPPAPASAPSPSLKQIIDQYTNDRKSAWTAKTRLEYEGYYKLFINIVGDKIISHIDRSVVRELRDTLTRLPAHVYKKHPNMSIAQVLELPDLVPMSTTTVNKLLTLFGSLMRHSVKEGYRTDNPVEGLKVQQNRRADEERKAYSRDDLKKITAALPSPAKQPERYWVPMIAMYSGMRLGEVCGLHVADIKQVDGVWCFDVNEDGDKRLKTASSTRLVPIHPTLISKGLLTFAEALLEKRKVRLWSNLVRRECDGYCPALGNWFGRFNRKHITEDRLKTFHSLRHSFADTLKQIGVQESLISELMGHANDSITTGRYGKRYQPKILMEAITMICYEDGDVAKEPTGTAEPSSDLSCGVT